MRANKKTDDPNRIPIRFVDEEKLSAKDPEESEREQPNSAGSEPSAEEIGRASIYEDETEVQRRIDRGSEEEAGMGQSPADDADTAGGPAHDELPEQREDRDTSPSNGKAPMHSADSEKGQSGAAHDHPVDPASGPMLAELLATRAELKRVEAERTELLDKLARRQADYDNYRKRVERERGETYGRVVGDVVAKLLPVMDNLRRALDAESTFKAGESEEFRHFLNGVELIVKQLNDVFESLGVEPVAAVGEPFDPHVHEAVAMEQTEEYEPDTVMQELLRGYRLGEKLLRPAIVKVATR